MAFSFNFKDMTHDSGFGNVFGGGSSLTERINKRLRQYDQTFLGKPEKNARVTSRLTHFGEKLENRLARLEKRGRGEGKRATKYKDLLEQIYGRIRPVSSGLDSVSNSPLARGAARVNREGRSATIYLGGFESTLGLGEERAPIAFEGGGGGSGSMGRGGKVRPSRVPASAFLGAYYGGAALGGGRRSYGGQIP